eukprot:TRINITY_DN5691_c0_g1_i2.p1 TRINITY_DN5691_c0_g1~~TRINITY_DN5691_c0_g1_i2.p1  ORF type:complete len:280 (-),score=27.07 TRINITY_DN5691_c0_g1_i2:13-852(-)
MCIRDSLSSGFIFYESDMNAQDEDGKTALYYAAKNGNEKFIKYLVDNGADANVRCKDNNTPMHAVFQSGNEMMIIYLLSKGGSLNILNNQGQSPIAFGNQAILRKLDLTNAIASVEHIRQDQAKTVNNDDRVNERKLDGDNLENPALNFGFKRLNRPNTAAINRKEIDESDEEKVVYSYVSRKNGDRGEDEMPEGQVQVKQQGAEQGSQDQQKRVFQMQEIEIGTEGGKLVAKLVLQPSSENSMQAKQPRILQKGDLKELSEAEMEQIKSKLLELQFPS